MSRTLNVDDSHQTLRSFERFRCFSHKRQKQTVAVKVSESDSSEINIEVVFGELTLLWKHTCLKVRFARHLTVCVKNV